jgi:predicted permease
VTLALGIGASTALFSIVDATILQPLPYPDPTQLVEVQLEIREVDGQVSIPSPSMADVRMWQQAGDVFAKVAGWGSDFGGRVVDGPVLERIRVNRFTEDYLSIHGVMPLLGRAFTLDDMQPGAAPVALLGHGYWQHRFGGRRDVIGETLRLDDELVTIVGVLPASFDAHVPLARPLQVPLAEFSRRGTGRISVLARLQPDVAVDAAAQRLLPVVKDAALDPQGGIPVRVVVESKIESAVGRSKTTVNALAGAVSLILLLACVNVAGLLLARGTTRQPEMAVRAALGARRSRLVRQLLIESAVLGLAGGVAGVLLAWLGLNTIVANLPMALPDNAPVTLNLRVLVATIALLVPTVVLSGLLPAMRLSEVRIASGFAAVGRQPGTPLSRRGGQCLIAVEVALAMLLVTSAGLMLRSFARLSAVDLGFDPDGLITMEVLPLDRNPSAHKIYYAELLQRLRAIPGVQSVGLVDTFTLGDLSSYSGYRGSGERVFTRQAAVLPGYFETIGARVREGRLPNDAEYASGFRVAVVNASAARALFPDGPAVGRQFSGGSRTGPWTVIGVIEDLRHGGPLDRRGPSFPQVFLPLEPTTRSTSQAMIVVLRPSRRIPNLVEHLRQAAESPGSRVLIERIRSADDWFGERVLTPRRRTGLLGLFGALGFVLALVGVFGMTAYAVSRRVTEIGVRMAFGAQPGQVVRATLFDAAVPIVVGVVLGLAGATATMRVIKSFLFETTPTDAVTFVSVALALAVSGCMAALLPAMRAARVDPVVALRAE